MEKITGIITGSCQFVDLPGHRDLEEMGLLGEGLIDHRCWIIKTHFPGNVSRKQFLTDKVICLIRNPIDSIFSSFNLKLSGFHDKNLHPDDFPKIQHVFKKMADVEIGVWRDFYAFWLNAECHVHWMRYEDMVHDPKWCLGEMMKFLLETDDISGSVSEKIIDILYKDKVKTAYEPRSGKVNANLSRYTED